MSRLVRGTWTFFLNSTFESGEVKVEASDWEEACLEAVRKHYGYDEMMDMEEFKQWVNDGPQDFAPTASLIHQDLVRVLNELK